jgi:hypothetical protein
MRHSRSRRGSMPVLLSGREPDHITRPDLLDRSTFALSPATACCDDECLSQRMRMPGSPRPRLERDTRTLNQCRLRRLEKRIDPYRASEPLQRPLSGRLRANSFDVHNLYAPVDGFTTPGVWAGIGFRSRPHLSADHRPTRCCRCSGYRAPCTVIWETALLMSRRSLELSSTPAAPIFSSRRCSLVVPGIGTIHGF